MASATREKIVSAGLQLFREHGFGNVGLDQILRDAGLTKTTFYNHFESKEHLVREALEVDQKQLAGEMKDQVEVAGSDPIDRILAIFDAIDRRFQNPSYKRCLAIAAAIEFPSPRDPIHELELQTRADRAEFLSELCQDANLNEPAHLAAQLGMLIDGAAISRQMESNRGAIASAKQVAKQLLRTAPNSGR